MFQGLLQSLFALLVAFGVIKLTVEQLGYIYAFSAALLSFVTRTQVTSLTNPKNNQGKDLVPKQ